MNSTAVHNESVLDKQEPVKIKPIIKDTINELVAGDKSVVIENMTPEYVPIAIESILEKSDKVVVLEDEDDSDIPPTYLKSLEDFVANEENHLLIYSNNSAFDQLLDTDRVSLFSLSPEDKKDLRRKNLKNAIIGDAKHYRIEKFDFVPVQPRTVKEMLRSILGLVNDSPSPVLHHKSETGFKNEKKAKSMLAFLNYITKKEHTTYDKT